MDDRVAPTSGEPPGRRDIRDRHGRGPRGPGVIPQQPGRRSLPTRPTPRERFDTVVLDTLTTIDGRWQDRLGLVEYAVEDTPQVPGDWIGEVPLSVLVRGSGAEPTRLVLFRRPIEHRCESRTEVVALVRRVLVTRVAELLGIDAEDVDPDR